MRTFATKPKRPQQVAAAPSHSTPADLSSFHASVTTSLGNDFSGIPARSPERITMQAKLAVNNPGDVFEQEADQIAEQVTRAPERNAGPLRSKQARPGADQETAVPPIVHEVLASPGQPLDSAARSFMEPRFGLDLSHVRAHTDPKAAESAHAVNAHAYTVGSHIAFAAGQYAPQTGLGRNLLAHELTHVIQQQAGDRQLQRRLVGPPKGAISDVEFTVGQEVSFTLAQKAKAAAAKGITTKILSDLRETALADGTISDDERMFLAGLLEPGNAAIVAATAVKAGATITFSRSTIEPHMAEVRDMGRPTLDPKVADELKAAHSDSKHLDAANDEAVKQIHKLTGPKWRKQADAVIALSAELTAETLQAMTAAASDSTPGDMVMAGAVYIVAARANHPLTGDIKSGRIKVDQLPGTAPATEFAHYNAFGKGEKGDTIYLYADFDVNNLGHQRAIIHELEHASDDKSTQPRHQRATRRDIAEARAYRAGAKFTLERLAKLQDDADAASDSGDKKADKAATKAFEKAVTELVGQYGSIHIIALALEAHSNLKRFENLVLNVNAAMPVNQQMALDKVMKLLKDQDATVEAELRNQIQDEYKLKTPTGSLDPVKNAGKFDGLSGESVLDSVDFPMQTK